MKSETNDTNNVAPDSTPVQPETTRQPGAKPGPAEKTVPKVEGFQRFMRSVLIWLAVIVIAFLAGVLTLFFARYQPLNQTLTQTQGELTKAKQNVSQLTAEVTAVNNQLAGLKDGMQAMQTERDAAVTHLAIQQVLVDVTNTRLALVNNDVTSAKAALEQTATRLDVITPRIAEVDAKLAETMPQRLAIILSELDSNVDTAKVDLELLTDNLLSVETLLFKK